MVRAAFVVLAGGSGTRVGADRNKVYLPLAGRPVISWSLSWAADVEAVSAVVLVARPEDAALARVAIAAAEDLAGRPLDVCTVDGGATRHDSEQAALEHLRARILGGDLDVIAIHDGARPLAGADLLRTVVTTAAVAGGAVPTLPVDDVWVAAPGDHREADDGTDEGRDDGPLVDLLPVPEALHRVQTPQAFRARALLAAYDAALGSGTRGTDTASAFEAHPEVLTGDPDFRVVAVPGRAENLKVTYPADLRRAEALLR